MFPFAPDPTRMHSWEKQHISTAALVTETYKVHRTCESWYKMKMRLQWLSYKSKSILNIMDSGQRAKTTYQMLLTTYHCKRADRVEEFITHLTVPQRHKWVLKEKKEAGERVNPGTKQTVCAQCRGSSFEVLVWQAVSFLITVLSFYCLLVKTNGHIWVKLN